MSRNKPNYLQIFLIFFFYISHHVTPVKESFYGTSDDPPATDEQNFGKDMFCYFAYAGAMDKMIMEKIEPSAKYYGIGRLPNYRLDFIYSEKLDHVFLTISPEEHETVWGSAYLIPVSKFQNISDIFMEVDEIKIGHSVIETIEVDVNNQTLTVPCNIFPTIKQPKKISPLPERRRPTKEDLHFYLRCFRAANLPRFYINKLSKVPTKGS